MCFRPQFLPAPPTPYLWTAACAAACAAGCCCLLQAIALICTNRPGAQQLEFFTPDPPASGSGGASGSGAAAAAAIEAAAGAGEGDGEPPPKKKQRKGKEPLAAAAPAAAAAASGSKAAGKGGGSSQGDKLATEAAERAAAQEAPPTPPAANGPRATLIVCPLSVVSNWEMQIQEHTAGGLSGGLSGRAVTTGVRDAGLPPLLLSLFGTSFPRHSLPLAVCVYHGPDRDRRVKAISQYDVVSPCLRPRHPV